MNSRTALGIFTLVITIMILSVAASAATEQVLYTITNRNFAFPVSALIWDQAGNLYGVSSGGVFEMSPLLTTVRMSAFESAPRMSVNWKSRLSVGLPGFVLAFINAAWVLPGAKHAQSPLLYVVVIGGACIGLPLGIAIGCITGQLPVRGERNHRR